MEEKVFTIGNIGKKICLITDLHFLSDYDLNLLNKIELNVKQHNPDFICLSGDIIDYADMIYDKSINNLIEFVKKLAKVSQVIISLGNHDITKKGNIKADYNKLINWFMKLNKIENVYFLNNKNLIRDNICFIGFNPDYSYYKSEDIKIFIDELNSNININKKYYNILLCHSPINVFNHLTLKYSKDIKKTDLILSGHMHNGLVPKCFDFNGNFGLISPLRKPFPKYARNKITKTIDGHSINLIISGGISKLSSSGNNRLIRKLNKFFKPSITYINI